MLRRSNHPGQIGDYWLSQRPNSPAWCRTWFDPRNRQTRRTSLGTEDFSEAQLRLAEWVTEHQRLTYAAPEDVPVDMVLVRYYKGHAQHIPSAEQAMYACRKLSDFFSGLMVSDLTLDRLEDFMDWMREAKASDGYISRTLSTLKAALNRAYKRQEIQRVPYIPLPKNGPPRDRLLTLNEAAALFNACDTEHLFFYLMLAFTTLARPSALLELTSAQINLEDNIIELNPPGRQQTKKYRPAVPLIPILRPWVSDLLPGPVITYNDHQIASIKTAFRATRSKAGLDSSVTPYTIRHTMATVLRRNSVEPWDVSGMLGHQHQGFRTTEIYAKYDPAYLAKAAETIEAWFTALNRLTQRDLFTPQPITAE